MTPDCPSCGAAGARELGRIPPGYTFAGRVLDQAMGEAIMYRCRHCEVGFRWPQPSAEELSELYQLGESDQWTYDAPARVDWQIAAQVLEDEGVSRVLDVGCFEGGFLVGLPKRIKRFGIEISPEAAAKARDAGIEIVGHTIEE
ncbi:MAG: hypothetical protein HKN29_03510, partial [Rhodothermales bacterium]|nr:hypothetical protein [Rhodothermales bacterium]